MEIDIAQSSMEHAPFSSDYSTNAGLCLFIPRAPINQQYQQRLLVTWILYSKLPNGHHSTSSIHTLKDLDFLMINLNRAGGSVKTIDWGQGGQGGQGGQTGQDGQGGQTGQTGPGGQITLRRRSKLINAASAEGCTI